MLAKLVSILSPFFVRGRTSRMRRFVLGHVGKTQVEAGTRSVILVGGTDDASRMAQALDMARQAIQQGCTVLFFDSMPGSTNAAHLCGYARESKREGGFYIRGAFDASEVDLADVLSKGDILYWGPSQSADSPQAFADDLRPTLEELSVALMQRVGRPSKSHVVVIMIDVVEAFGRFPEQIRSLPTSLNSLDASLICCEYDEAIVQGDIGDSIDFHLKVQVTPPANFARRPGASRRENLREGEALIKARATAHDIGPVLLSYLKSDPIATCPLSAVNLNDDGSPDGCFP